MCSRPHSSRASPASSPRSGRRSTSRARPPGIGGLSVRLPGRAPTVVEGYPHLGGVVSHFSASGPVANDRSPRMPGIKAQFPLLAAQTVDAVGSGCSAPLMLLFLTTQAGIRIGTAGAILSITGFVTLVVPALT